MVTCEEEGGVMVEPQYPRDTNDDIINGKVKVFVGASALEGCMCLKFPCARKEFSCSSTMLWYLEKGG